MNTTKFSMDYLKTCAEGEDRTLAKLRKEYNEALWTTPLGEDRDTWDQWESDIDKQELVAADAWFTYWRAVKKWIEVGRP